MEPTTVMLMQTVAMLMMDSFVRAKTGIMEMAILALTVS